MAYRWNQPVAGVCDHVCNATLQDQLGGVPAPRPEPAVLHLAKRRVSATDQGVYAGIFRWCYVRRRRHRRSMNRSTRRAPVSRPSPLRPAYGRYHVGNVGTKTMTTAICGQFMTLPSLHFYSTSLQRRETGVRPRPACNRYGRRDGLTPRKFNSRFISSFWSLRLSLNTLSPGRLHALIVYLIPINN